MEKDPLEDLVHTQDWKQGYEIGYRAGEDSMMEEMKDDFDTGLEKGVEKGLKYIRDVSKIANQWNIREIDATTAIEKVFKYVYQKAKKKK